MSRQLQRKLEKRKKKSEKKLVLTPAKTGLTPQQLSQLGQLTINAESFLNKEQYEAAAKHCHIMLNIYPKHADAFHMLGKISAHYKDYGQAVELYEKALKIAKDNPRLLNDYGLALQNLNRIDEALKSFNRSLRLDGDNAATLNNKGGVLKITGQVSEALECFHKAIRNNPGLGIAYHNIAYAHKFKANDEVSALFEEIEPKLNELPNADQINLGFALGKYYEDLKDYKKGFQYFLHANVKKRSTVEYNPDNHTNQIAHVKGIFSKGGEWGTHKDVGSRSKVPIFILGMPRSGTTLIEQILASHPNVFGAGELKIMSEITKNFMLSNEVFSSEDSKLRTKFAEETRKWGDLYVEEIRKYSRTSDHVTDKMPHNFRHVGLINLILPHAKIIHCTRNPIDICLSNFRLLFNDNMDYTYNLEELGKFYLEYHEIMEHWNEVLPERMLEVQYEDVVGDLETQARRLIKYCGLEWDDACLEFYKTKRNVKTASYTQVREGIYSGSVGRWEQYGDLLDPLLNVLKPVL